MPYTTQEYPDLVAKCYLLKISSKIEKGMKESSAIHNQIESDKPSLQIRLILRFSLSWFIFTYLEISTKSEEKDLLEGESFSIYFKNCDDR
ncbi:hypothetical protein BpHYR1_015761 [Brachionus plicatilis]|uniref:Uncharacterized protein n=1 Tax=Brachionus plicatilis TaxID=10195 RepID=A0A3M7SLQ0_BRAPC|nr:hypothetical protein BpHYR1_015761 [Brachionus plicatilis]